MSREDAYYIREQRYDVAPNPFPFFFGSPFQSQPGYYDQRRNNGYYQDGQGRYIQAPRDSAPSQYGQAQQYGRDPRVQVPPPRDPYGRQYRATAAHRSGLHLGPSAILKDIHDAQP